VNPAVRSSGLAYLGLVAELLERVGREEWPALRRAAELIADALADGQTIHAFGTGHSHMLAEELYYRAGGLVRVRPILFEGLMLHASAPLSTSLERLPELADALFADQGIVAGDVLIVASNSGSNAVASRLVQRTREVGARVIAVTSLRHATSADARSNELPRLHELADVVIDNGGAVGDASIDIAGFDRRVGPTSTVVGAAILNAVVAEAVQLLVDRGVSPDVYASSNTEGGDAANSRFRHRAGSR
jgi:uncharacterized phosphosugar-binding protein